MFCRFNFLTKQSADDILGDSPQMLPASRCRAMTTVEGSQVGAFCLGNGHFDLIRERPMHLQLLMLDGRVAAGTADKNSSCSCVRCVVGLCLCGTKFSLVVS